MNIKQAKEQISAAVTAYRTRDEYGRPVIPQHHQRPVFLMGPPGVGKTAIMEQIAQEMGIPLVSYSMTHHTRQSALGLPFIRDQVYDGKTYRVSEYTMSEIIASMYDKMEQTGIREGILFLDEINCVSETLAPSMLQFLQYKVFGQHKIPEGWIVVTAGNPPEYNQNVREFDMVTWDRLKRIDVEADYETWRNWAAGQAVHPAVLSYLDIRKDDFSRVETTVDGKRFVTPRGWVDLSDMLKLYERHKIAVDGRLTAQYLQNPEVSKRFASYYDLWLKYRADYQVESILKGKEPEEIVSRARKAGFDERITLVGLLMDAMLGAIRTVMRERECLSSVMPPLKKAGAYAKDQPGGKKTAQLLQKEKERLQAELEKQQAGGLLTREKEGVQRDAIRFLEDAVAELPADLADDATFKLVKKRFDARVQKLKAAAAETSSMLENLFRFAEKAFGDGQEMLIIVTELTASPDAALFISQYGCEGYFRHNKSLLFYERQVQVISEIDRMMDSLEEEDGDAQGTIRINVK